MTQRRIIDEDPTDRTLELIEEWPPSDMRGLVAFAKTAWHWPEWGFRTTQRRIYLSTGGWSGNESIISAMKRNFIFWSMHFRVHRVGGHYTLEMPKSNKKRGRGSQK